MKLNKEQREKCRIAADLIFGAFTWDDSDEGEDYWNAVYEALDKYAEEPAADDETALAPVTEELVDFVDARLSQVYDAIGALAARFDALKPQTQRKATSKEHVAS